LEVRPIEEFFSNYLYTYTGKKFNVLEPACSNICLRDIAHSLSMLCRFNGHCKQFYSVAQHSLDTAKLIKKQGFPVRTQLYGLLHDAAEAFVCDMPKPVKELIPQYKRIENEIQAVIWDTFHIPRPTAEENAVVKKADEVLLAYEIRLLMYNAGRQPQCLSGVKNRIRIFLSFGKEFMEMVQMQLLYTSFIPRRYVEVIFIKTVEKLLKQTNTTAKTTESTLLK